MLVVAHAPLQLRALTTCASSALNGKHWFSRLKSFQEHSRWKHARGRVFAVPTKVCTEQVGSARKSVRRKKTAGSVLDVDAEAGSSNQDGGSQELAASRSRKTVRRKRNESPVLQSDQVSEVADAEGQGDETYRLTEPVLVKRKVLKRKRGVTTKDAQVDSTKASEASELEEADIKVEAKSPTLKRRATRKTLSRALEKSDSPNGDAKVKGDHGVARETSKRRISGRKKQETDEPGSRSLSEGSKKCGSGSDHVEANENGVSFRVSDESPDSVLQVEDKRPRRRKTKGDVLASDSTKSGAVRSRKKKEEFQSPPTKEVEDSEKQELIIVEKQELIAVEEESHLAGQQELQCLQTDLQVVVVDKEKDLPDGECTLREQVLSEGTDDDNQAATRNTDGVGAAGAAESFILEAVYEATEPLYNGARTDGTDGLGTAQAGGCLMPEAVSEAAEPLYVQIERRRIEEQEKRASLSPRKKKYSPLSELRFTLDNCSRFGDVNGALAAYEAHRESIPFDLYNYNVLLYLCSSAALGVLAPCKQSRQRPDYAQNQTENGFSVLEEQVIEEEGVVLRGNMAGLTGENEMGFTREMMQGFLTKGLDIYEQMQRENVAPNEATFTALARLAVAKRDGDLAFDIVKAMVAADIPPKLRCYGPALYIYFKENNAGKALEVFNHMLIHNVEPDEAELEVLVHLAAKAGLSGRVYTLLHQLRQTVRDVSESTVNVIERWFRSDFAAKSMSEHSAGGPEVQQASKAKGGGWHGLGWLGDGPWSVEYTQLTSTGVCRSCKEQMVTIDISPSETENFAKCVSALAFKREHNSHFGAFKDWLETHEPFETVVDGANVGFYNQRSAELDFAQLNSVVSELHRRSGRWPLVVLHVKRTTTGSGKTHYAQQMLRKLSSVNALYTAPAGSNDDWYWLYAAVKSKCLLVSNDEMRDHIFQLLGREYFPTWKERHQVRFHVTNRGPIFYMPPPYSIIIQESEQGSWHVPVSGGDDISAPRKWMCVTRR